MTIGFDAKRIVGNGTGLGSYGRTLINDLADIDGDDTFMLYAPDEGCDELRSQVQPHDNVFFRYPEGMRFRLQRDFWRTRGIVKDLKRDGVTLFHGLSGELPVGIRKAGIPTVVTIHDLIFMRHPEYYNWIDVQIYKHKFFNTLKEADRIIAISERTKQDIIELGGFPADKIEVIYQSCGRKFGSHICEETLQSVHARYELPARYILNVGTIEERKNVMLAVKALRQLPKELSLVIVGRPTPYTRKVQSYADRNGLHDRVRFLHGVSNHDLPAIYHYAECFVYPSRYEGFGIPVIEAIQSGLPVVACTGSCLEEAGGPYNQYVDPDDERGMAEAVMSSVNADETIISRSQEYIKRFENSNVAQQVLDIYRNFEH